MMLSNRLQTITGYVPAGSRLADIACDHAQLARALVQAGAVDLAIAADLRSEPLRRARRAAAEEAIQPGRLVFRQGDGLEVLDPGECDVIVIAGVGGKLIEQMLKARPEVAQAAGRLILSPQRSPWLVRQWAQDQGYAIYDEQVVMEDGYFYEIIVLDKAPEPQGLSQLDIRLGPIIAQGRDSLSRTYLAWRRAADKRALAKMALAAEEHPAIREKMISLQAIWKEWEKRYGYSDA
ncbi:tRNA (adenine(22)-N(1))-methyltransferase [Peptococcus simiae]|uniref:tRNA (Adenine(22)-N(1))-methyltransferase n=1 Tax=Peptococcus simiae TaxID=1643805 RepID=A0ABW9GYR8_9FIRM